MDDSSEDNPIPGSSLYNTQALPDWGGGGYSPTIPFRVCADQRSRDFGTPDWNGVSIFGTFPRMVYNISKVRKLKNRLSAAIWEIWINEHTQVPTPPPPGHVNGNTIMAVGTEDLTILYIYIIYMVEREIEEQMVNLPLLFTTWFVAENICSFCKMTRACF